MFDRVKDNYEYDFWTKEKGKENHYNECYKRSLQEFGIDEEFESIIELGAGPFSGFLPLFNAKRKVSVDPLNDRYKQDGFKMFDDIEYITDYFEDINFTEKFDAFFSKNSLDHGEMSFKTLEKIYSILNDGGKFYLLVNLRTEEQLNVGHDHSLTHEDFISEASRCGFKILKDEVWDTDKIHGDGYKTLCAVLQK